MGIVSPTRPREITSLPWGTTHNYFFLLLRSHGCSVHMRRNKTASDVYTARANLKWWDWSVAPARRCELGVCCFRSSRIFGESFCIDNFFRIIAHTKFICAIFWHACNIWRGLGRSAPPSSWLSNWRSHRGRAKGQQCSPFQAFACLISMWRD